jgi:MFS family permease
MSADRRIPTLIKRNTVLLAATQAFVGAGSQLTPALSAIMVVQLLGSSTLAGLGTSMLSVAKFAIAYPIGWVADNVGRKAALFIGQGLALVGTLTIGTAVLRSSFPLLVLGLLVFGLGVGAGQQLRLAAADLYPPDRRAQGLGYVLTGSLIGVLGGPLLITLASRLGPELGIDPIALAWMLVPAVLVPGMLLVFAIHPDPRDIAKDLRAYYGPDVVVAPPASADLPSGNGVRDWLAHYPLRVAFVASLAAQGVMSLMMAMTSLALDHHGHGLQAISISVSIHVVGMYGLSIPLGRLSDRIGRRNVMLIGAVLSGLGSVLVGMATEYAPITLGTFLVGVGWSCTNVSTSALVADVVAPEDRGRAIGTCDTFSGAGAIVLPLVGGPLVELIGFPVLAVIGPLLVAVPFAMLLRLTEGARGQYAEAAAD